MRSVRTAAAVATLVVALLTPTTAHAGHNCLVRVSTTGSGGGSQAVEAEVGDTVHVYFHHFDGGPITLEWIVDGTVVEAKSGDVTPEISPITDRRRPRVARVLDADDVGTVTVRGHKEIRETENGPLVDCWTLDSVEQDERDATIRVSPALPSTDTAAVRDIRTDVPPGVLLLVAASVVGAWLATRRRLGAPSG